MATFDPPPITVKELADEVGLPLQSLDKAFREEHIHLLAEFCDPWELTGYHLKLTKVDISTIRNDNETTPLKRIATLGTWSEKFAHKATYRVLVEALILSKHAKQALKLCEKLHSIAPPPVTENVTPCHSSLSVAAVSLHTRNEELVSQGVDITQSMRQLEMQFVRIQNHFLLPRAAGTAVTLEQLQICVSTLPSFAIDAPQLLLEANSIQLFIFNLKHYCSALNPDILEGLIEVLGDEETKSMMISYNKDLHEFQCKTKLKDFIGYYNGPSPVDFEEVKLKLGNGWREKTLADLKLINSQNSRHCWLVKLASMVYVILNL